MTPEVRAPICGPIWVRVATRGYGAAMALGGMAELVAASRETVRSELGVGDIGGTLDVPDTQIKAGLVRESLPKSLSSSLGIIVLILKKITLKPFGEMIQFEEHIFELGWFNHQLDLVHG